MKLKNSKTISVYPDYETAGTFFIEGVKDAVEALAELEKEMEDYKGVWRSEDAKLVNLHRCIDCEMEWTHDGDYVCGECGEYRLSKKYKEVYLFEKKYT